MLTSRMGSEWTRFYGTKHTGLTLVFFGLRRLTLSIWSPQSELGKIDSTLHHEFSLAVLLIDSCLTNFAVTFPTTGLIFFWTSQGFEFNFQAR